MNIKPVADFYYDAKYKRLVIVCQPVEPKFPLGPMGRPLVDVFVKEGRKNGDNEIRFPFKRKGEQ